MAAVRLGCWWAALTLCLGSVAALDFVYHDHDNITAFLTNVSQTYPEITYMHSIGKSIQGELNFSSFAPNLCDQSQQSLLCNFTADLLMKYPEER